MGVVELRQYLSIFTPASAAGSKRKRTGSDEKSAGRNGENNLQTSDFFDKIALMGSDITCVLTRSGEVIDCTVATGRFHGLQGDDLRAGGFLDRLHVSERPAFLMALADTCEQGTQARLELRLRCPSPDRGQDRFVWIELICSVPDREETGTANETETRQPLLAVVRDISHWKQREEEANTDRQRLREELAGKTRLLAAMSHALRTPLNAIIGFSEMMTQPGIEADNAQQVFEYAGIIHDSGKHLLGVVDEIRELSQFDVGQYRADPHTFPVADLVKAAVEIVGPEAAERDVRLLTPEIRESLQICADYRVCKQALAGVLALAISSAREKQAQRIHIAVEAHRQTLDFIVTVGGVVRGGLPVLPPDGSQLSTFVELLAGRLHGGRNTDGQSFVSISLPTGLPVAIGDTASVGEAPVYQIDGDSPEPAIRVAAGGM